MKAKVLMSYEEPTDEQLNELLSTIGSDTRIKALRSHQLMHEKIAKAIIEANKKWKLTHS
jgi:hypothetical protein